MTEVEYPDGLPDGIWPLNTEGHMEMWDGCLHWSGGPWQPEDLDRAERLFHGWTALTNEDGYGLLLCPPDKVDHWVADGWMRILRASAELEARLLAAMDSPTVRRPRRQPVPVPEAAAPDELDAMWPRRPEREAQLTEQGFAWTYADAVPLDRIDIEASAELREGGIRSVLTLHPAIERYTIAMQAGDIFPAILLEGDLDTTEPLIILDGLAVCVAARNAQRPTLAAYILPPGARRRIHG